MILALAVLVGLLVSLLWVWFGGRQLAAPNLRLVWLVPAAFVPQWLAFYWPATQGWLADSTVAVSLMASQLLLLLFVWLNRRQPGFWALGLGLTLNLLVISLNGGLMPISPEMVSRFELRPDTWEIGSRLGSSKDIVLPIAETRLWTLSDRFFLPLPSWAANPVAFSLGDVLIAFGAFWFTACISTKQGAASPQPSAIPYH
jgi:hypothetical protein